MGLILGATTIEGDRVFDDGAGPIFLALLIKTVPLLLALGAGVFLLRKTEVGRALVSRLRSSPAHDARVVELEQELDDVTQQLNELQERQDFAERLVAKDHPRDELKR